MSPDNAQKKDAPPPKQAEEKKPPGGPEAVKAQPEKTHVAAQWKHTSPLIACRFDPLGKYVFATSQDNKVLRWDLATAAKTELAAHDSWVRGIGFSADGQVVITGGGDGRLIWWQATAEKPTPTRTVEAHQGWIRSVSTSPDGKLLATGGNDNLVKLWNIADGKLLHELKGHQAHVYSAQFHPNGEFLISGDLKGQVHQWEVATGKLVRTFDAKVLHSYNGGQGVDFGGVRALAVSDDSKYLACGGLHKATNPLGAVHEPIVLLFDWESRKVLQTHVAEGLKGVVWRAVFHPREKFLVCASGGSSGGYLLFWKADQPKEFHKLKLPHLARDMDIHPDRLQLALTHYDSQLRIYKMTPKPA